MFRLFVAFLALSSQVEAYGNVAPTKGMTIYTGAKNGNIYRTAPLAAQPKQARTDMVFMSGAEEVVQYEMFDPVKVVVLSLPWFVLLLKFGGVF